MISLAKLEVVQQEDRKCILTAQSTRGWGGSMSELSDPPVIHGTAPQRASNDVGFPSPLRPQETSFTAGERGSVTILFGGLTLVSHSQFAGKLWSHLYGDALTTVLPTAARELRNVEVDWLRVKPVVTVIGEFWAQMTESDGNFRMLDFLEMEGAEVSIEPISIWILYLLQQKKANAAQRARMARYTAPWTSPRQAALTPLASYGKSLGFSVGAGFYRHHFHRLATLLGFPPLHLASQRELAQLAEPFYDPRLRGGEGRRDRSLLLSQATRFNSGY